jgi:serine/threonine protein kinase
MLGREFGGVRIERILGSGGMGRVYLGIDVASGERVAIKVLLRTQQDEGVRRRFEREGRLLERLRHPGIASVLRTGVVQDGDVDVPYIVMEHVDGVQNLADHVFRERLGVRETVQAFLQACDAVGHAHREGFIHRDVKPPNLLVDRHGRVKVIDFGVARAIAADPAINTVRTETGQLVGTMQYMSPEQFRADPRMVDARSDVYALGAVLYELLAGVQPHDLRGLPVHEAARAVCETDPADVAFEIDILWAHFGGADPAAVIERYGSRVKLLHLKDLRRGVPGDLSGRTPPENDVVLGAGQIDIPAVLKAARKAGVAHAYIEDESPLFAEQVPQSIAYLQSLGE